MIILMDKDISEDIYTESYSALCVIAMSIAHTVEVVMTGSL